MKLTILGCSGSVPTIGNPASGYLIRGAEDSQDPAIIMDLGPGTLAALQEYHDPANAHILISHLHADHCMDFPSLMVWRRYHPQAPARSRHIFHGPAHSPIHLGRLSSDIPDGVDDFSDSFAFSQWVAGQREQVDRFWVTPFRAVHPIETYALRVEERRTGASLFYTADTAYSPELVAAAQGADIMLAEAAWGAASEDANPPGMHMTGAEAGRLAREAGVKQLVLVHLQPWGDHDATVAQAQEAFGAEVILGRPGMHLEV